MAFLHSNDIIKISNIVNQCVSPMYIKAGISVNCGKCPQCKKRRKNDWIVRLINEERKSISSAFITLTYDTREVPITKKGFMTLSKEDVQKFFRRLRRLDQVPGEKILKYYLTGEYGGRRGRPHYHIILFNVRNFNNVEKAWEKGNVHFGTVKKQSVAYTLKYIEKKKYKIPFYSDQDKEFTLMSKGLGESYWTEQIRQYHINQEISHIQIDGFKYALPRYYWKKFPEYVKQSKIDLMQQSKVDQYNYLSNKIEDLENIIFSMNQQKFNNLSSKINKYENNKNKFEL